MSPPSDTKPPASSQSDDITPRSASNLTTREESEDAQERESTKAIEEGETHEHDIEQQIQTDDNNPTSSNSSKPTSDSDAPPLPHEDVPPLPNEPLPDDGWQPVWDETAQAFYFYNRFTGINQWTNPRVPDVSPAVPSSSSGAPGTSTTESAPALPRPAGGYDPSIHGDYDPNAWYAQQGNPENVADPSTSSYDPSNPPQIPDYAATGTFNRFTGKWQAADLNPEKFSDEAKSKRQMGAFFDVDAAANSHDGRSLKAERAGKKLSKQELKEFKEKRKARKEEKRRAWLRD